MLTANPVEVAESSNVDVVVEVMGGIEPARTCLLRAMALGKAAVTANKQLMATHGAELQEQARSAGVDLAFEASVGAGIPLIKPLKESLVAARIHAVTGILNGTTNYVLTRMARDGTSFEEALDAAQQRGFAEANPTEDIDGHDAAAKLAILASVAFNSHITVHDVYREGIGRVSARDIAYAREMGFGIKLLAIGRNQDEQIEVRVHPALLPLDHPLALVADEFNAVLVEGRDLGPVVFSGRGAGGAPTAAAIVADVIDCVRNLRAGARARVQPVRLPARRIRSIDDVVRPQFVSLQVTDRPGVFAIVASIFGEEHVSIASIVQKSRGAVADVVLVTHATPEKAMRRVLHRLGALDVVKAINNCIRVEAEV
jgi:homoserine dehydrogenase